MHRTAVIGLFACLALAGCSSNATTPDAKPSALPSADPGEKFVNSVVDAHLGSYSDGIPAAAELKVFPPKWCDALDAGHSVEWMLGEGDLYPIGETWGTEKPDAYQLVVLGVGAYCPRYGGQVKRELRAAGVY